MADGTILGDDEEDEVPRDDEIERLLASGVALEFSTGWELEGIEGLQYEENDP